MSVFSFNRTLDQELLTLLRGASLECLVCGEFVMRFADQGGGVSAVACPECRSIVADGTEVPEVDLPSAETRTG
jgi:hypothetical protein